MKRYLDRVVMTVSQSYYTRRKHSSRMPTTRFSGHHWMSAPGCTFQKGVPSREAGVPCRGRCTLQEVYLSGGCTRSVPGIYTHHPKKRTWDRTRHTHAPKRDPGPDILTPRRNLDQAYPLSPEWIPHPNPTE